MVLPIENSTVSTQKPLEPINKYKINIQKSVVFLYTNEEMLGRESKQIPFKTASKIT